MSTEPTLRTREQLEEELRLTKELYAAFVGEVYEALSLRLDDVELEQLPGIIAERNELACSIPDMEQELQRARSEAHAAYHVGVADVAGTPRSLSDPTHERIKLLSTLEGAVKALDSGLPIQPNTLAHRDLKKARDAQMPVDTIDDLARTGAELGVVPDAMVECEVIVNGSRLEHGGSYLTLNVPNAVLPPWTLVEEAKRALNSILLNGVATSMYDALMAHDLTAGTIAGARMEVDLKKKIVVLSTRKGGKA